MKDRKLKSETYALFLFGILGGILGGMISNVMDRNFAHFGRVYDVVVVTLFFICIEFLIRIFKKKLGGRF